MSGELDLLSDCLTGKRRYATRLEAERRLAGGFDPHRSKTPSRVYECSLCHGWHLTARARRRGSWS